LIKEMIENIGIIRKNRGTNSSAVWFDLDGRCLLLPVSLCLVFLRLSLFALRLSMFVGLMHTFLCWLEIAVVCVGN
jgi:hypothetical protein